MCFQFFRKIRPIFGLFNFGQLFTEELETHRTYRHVLRPREGQQRVGARFFDGVFTAVFEQHGGARRSTAALIGLETEVNSRSLRVSVLIANCKMNAIFFGIFY